LNANPKDWSLAYLNCKNTNAHEMNVEQGLQFKKVAALSWNQLSKTFTLFRFFQFPILWPNIRVMKEEITKFDVTNQVLRITLSKSGDACEALVFLANVHEIIQMNLDDTMDKKTYDFGFSFACDVGKNVVPIILGEDKGGNSSKVTLRLIAQTNPCSENNQSVFATRVDVKKVKVT
jgi:hypothetical protein